MTDTDSRVPLSLRGRLLRASAVILPLVIVLAGLALLKAFHSSLESAEASQARLQVYLLLGALEVEDGRLTLPSTVLEPGFNRPNSGVYGFIHGEDRRLFWRSGSSLALPDTLVQRLPSSLLKPGQSLLSHLPEQQLYLFQYPVIWESAAGEMRLLISVLRSDESVRSAMKAFSLQLLGWLSGICLVALLAQYFIMRWGLRPLDLLTRDLKRIEDGESDQLEHQYPVEVQGVTDSLNRLIESERKQRERYRNTLGDLAHSLKTPLAVIHGAGDEGLDFDSYRQQVEEQAQRMQQIVQYQLARAVKTEGRTLAQTLPVAPVVDRLLRVMEKVYARQPKDIEAVLDPEAGFAGDERDLMELLGNLIDNAFKYGDGRVRVVVELAGPLVQIEVSDDGRGVAPRQRQVILQRGARLDTQAPGQGIGLAVALDIVSSYDGALEVSESDLGGACFRVSLPGGPVMPAV
ncbi:two-component system sensor histidine kinase PhoQ [Marinobacterium halophilum]|uniref:histidine kinase n=1 Tax=Marinobacterium halophilum TaxID=267374 RepID=A0A2P8EWV8_9GAMM|nr:ATP-binding protein [Marinobacterium halophilum]PSL13905.1 two-component system sensor histidine kinase PhoQ [Marinobacterium halophilum]